MQPDQLRVEIYRKMSASQKWTEVSRLREIAWQLKTAAIRSKHPDWTSSAVEAAVRKVFLYAVT